MAEPCLVLENLGNAAASLAMSGADPAEALFIEAQPPQAKLEPGAASGSPCQVISAQRRT